VANDERLLVILFTDMVASTAYRRILGDAVADALMYNQNEELRAVIQSHAGTYVKSLGDGVMAWFPAASLAVDAAMELQRAVCRARGLAGLFPMRVGLAVGDIVVQEDGDVFGTPVVEASRLCSQAKSGRILCSATMRTLVGTRATVPFVDVGALTLKGMSEPVPALEIDWLASTKEGTWLVLHEREATRYADLTNRTSVVVGAAHECDIVIVSDRSVSRRHCELNHREGGWWAADLQSRNNTLLNGKRVEHDTILVDGDMLQLGALDIEFHAATTPIPASETHLHLQQSVGGVDGDTTHLLTLLCRPLLEGDVLSEPATIEEISVACGRPASEVEAALNTAAQALAVRPGSWYELAQTALLRGLAG
jgi:class 3 adenylate cyclase